MKEYVDKEYLEDVRGKSNPNNASIIEPAVPPNAHSMRDGVRTRGQKPTLLTDDKVEILLSKPNTWFLIGVNKEFKFGGQSVTNIKRMTQANIRHLSGMGEFDIVQRKKEEGMVGIYCRWLPKSKKELLELKRKEMDELSQDMERLEEEE